MSRNGEPAAPLTHVVYHVLLSLARAARHGYGIIKDVAERTDGRLELEAGTLYAAVKRLRDEGWIEEVDAPASADARRRYYAITAGGRAALRAESERLAELVRLAREARVLPSTEGRG
ncbi:MAG: helix-turn-helix transcriptional regulator [Gemmatimonadetes bacterium]|nr:helix-turn-helix transcriptional regulator [Gemmatimonadota bacterium]